MEDYFDSIDLENLAESESAIIQDPSEGRRDEAPKPSAVIAPEQQAIITEDPDSLDIDALAESDSIDIITGTSNEKEGKPRTSQTPASSTDGQKSPSSPDAFTSFAAALKDAGVLSSLEEEDLESISDTAGLLKAIEKQIKANEFSQLSEKQKAYLEAVESGIPEDEVVKRQNSIDQYEKLSDEQINTSQPLQYELIRRSFIIKGFDASTADKFAKLALQDENSQEEAINAKSALVAHERKQIQDTVELNKAAKQKEIEAEQTLLSSLKSKINETSEVLPGIQINSTTKEKIFTSLTSPIGVENGEPLNEVMKKYKDDVDYKMRLHALHVVTKGFTDFSKFEKAAKSKSISAFDEALKNNYTSRNGAAASKGGFSGGDGFTSEQIGEALKNIQF